MGQTTFKSGIHYSTHAYLDVGHVCDPSTERRFFTILLNLKVSATLRLRAGLIWKTPGLYLPVLIGSAGERTKNAQLSIVPLCIPDVRSPACKQ